MVTPADDPRENLWFASVKDLAFENYLPVYQPRDPNAPEFVEVLRRLKADFLFSCYYRQMLKQPLLDLPRLGALNLHGSLLPRYRGRCPVNWVLIHGETETGVTLHYMEEKPDKGDIVGQKRVAITPEDTAVTLFARMTVAAGALLQETYPLLRAGTAPRLPQDQGRASYFGGRKPADGLISWDKDAVAVYNLVRAVTHPYPGAFTYFRGKKLFIWAGKPLAAPPAVDPAAAGPGDGRDAGGGAAGGHRPGPLPHHPGPVGGPAGVFGPRPRHLGLSGGGKIGLNGKGRHLRVALYEVEHLGTPLQFASPDRKTLQANIEDKVRNQ